MCSVYVSISREKDTTKIFCLTTKFSDYEIRLFDETHIKRAQHDIGGNLYFMYSCYTLKSGMMMRSNKIKKYRLRPSVYFKWLPYLDKNFFCHEKCQKPELYWLFSQDPSQNSAAVPAYPKNLSSNRIKLSRKYLWNLVNPRYT